MASQILTPMTKFCYDLALPLVQDPSNIYLNLPWHVIEKGTEQRIKNYVLSYNVITRASAFLHNRRHIISSPYQQISFFPNEGQNTIYLKRELQPFQSVKERGVIYTLLQLSEDHKRRGVITISTGTFAYILCYYGNKFNIPVTVVMPTLIANDFIKKCQDTGSKALVIIQGTNMIEAHRIALYIAATRGLFYLDGNDHPNMIIGQATLGLEMVNDIDAVILPTIIQNCGLTAGIATAIKETNPNIQVIEVLCTAVDPVSADIRKLTMSYNELECPFKTYPWQSGAEPKAIFDSRIWVTGEAISIACDILERVHVYDFHAPIGLAAFVSGNLNWLKGKRVLIPVFGAMDSLADFLKNTNTSNSSEPSAGPSTSRE